MKTKKCLILSLLTLSFYSSLVRAQEVLTDLKENSTIIEHFNQKQTKSPYRIASLTDTLNLPFIDDFSKGFYPSNLRWLDSNVYINNTYPINPPTIGVVTFDGLNKQGVPYQINSPTAQGKADSLTSKYINLRDYYDNVKQTTLTYGAEDSVYLSFFYESRGLGNAPEAEDSLMLQFKVARDSVWHTVRQFTYAGNDSVFKQSFIRIDTAYLKRGFQFRFVNYATLSGNLDHWHVDYVRLDRKRSKNDTGIVDLAFIQNINTILTPYTAMPWWQYATQNEASAFNVQMRNNNPLSGYNITYKYELFDNGNSSVFSSLSNPTIDPYKYKQVSPLLGYSIPTAPSKYSYTTYRVQNTISASPDVNHSNDTISFTQVLYNYFSYDDGTAENGYGLNVTDALLAMEFTLNKADTLTAVDMHFEHLIYDYSERAIHISVWKDLNQPAIYESGVVNPHYGGFYRYTIPPQPVSGTFYVGWRQESADILNIGFDKNTDASNHLHYMIDGTGWKTSLIKGSVMIRPVFGNNNFVGITEHNNNSISGIKVYPNPCNDNIFINYNFHNSYQYCILNTLGEIVLQGNNNGNTLNMSTLPEGFYILKISSSEITHPFTAKFIISR